MRRAAGILVGVAVSLVIWVLLIAVLSRGL